MGARWYEPDDAVFTARDTYAGAARTPVSLNRYTYANGDPMEYFDPDGRKSKKKQAGDLSDARPTIGCPCRPNNATPKHALPT